MNSTFRLWHPRNEADDILRLTKGLKSAPGHQLQDSLVSCDAGSYTPSPNPARAALGVGNSVVRGTHAQMAADRTSSLDRPDRGGDERPRKALVVVRRVFGGRQARGPADRERRASAGSGICRRTIQKGRTHSRRAGWLHSARQIPLAASHREAIEPGSRPRRQDSTAGARRRRHHQLSVRSQGAN